MGALFIIIALEQVELALEVHRIPKEHLVEVLSTYGADQALHEWMRHWNVGDGFDFVHVEDT